MGDWTMSDLAATKDEKNQTFADKVCGTVVVEVPRG
jgi:hypothetical protein